MAHANHQRNQVMRGGRSPKQTPPRPTAILDEFQADLITVLALSARPFDQVTFELWRTSPNPAKISTQRRTDEMSTFSVDRDEITEVWRCHVRVRTWLDNEPSAPFEFDFDWPATPP